MAETLGKKYSLISLFEDNNFDITIPLIQRDYVYGRRNKSEQRNDFLNTLKKYLLAGENKDLDFIYGYVENNNFIPLDGQQRITTLFLLYSYLAQVNDCMEEWRSIITSEGRYRFRYEVRRSSSQFCAEFIRYGIDFKEYESISKSHNSASKGPYSFADYVQDLHWYKTSWNLDTTVSSMVNMLFAIHEVFHGQHILFYERLFSRDNPVLTFLFLDLQDLNQGDELYIKMNARGKMLTPFENFKARFEEAIAVLTEKEVSKRILQYHDKEILLSTKDYFSFKLDSVWSNLFWKYRDLVGESTNYDDEIFNFIKEILIIYYVQQVDEQEHQLNQILRTPLENFNQLNSFNLITQGSINYLIRVLDALPTNNQGLKTYCQNRYFQEEEVFKAVLTHKISSSDRVKFYAYIEFLIAEPLVDYNLQAWMRVVCNLVDNKIINTQDMIIPAFKSINHLKKQANTIVDYLCKNPSISFFDNDQIIEEKIKAQLIKQIPSSYELIYTLEQGAFHAGQISYLLEFSGILDEVELSTCSLKRVDNISAQIPALVSLGEKAIKLFDYQFYNKDFIFERGVLTYGEYMIQKNAYQYNFSSSKAVANFDRDYSWKRILQVEFAKLQQVDEWKQRRLIIHAILQDPQFDFDAVENSLKARIVHAQSDKSWKIDFIRNPAYLDACGQGFIFTHNNFLDIQLLKASQMNHLRMDYYVHKFLIEQSEALKALPFKLTVESAKGYSEIPCVKTEDIILQRKNYAVKFQTLEGARFQILCYKAKGYCKFEDYGEELKELLTSLNFQWLELPSHGYSYMGKDFSKLTKLYINLVNRIALLRSE